MTSLNDSRSARHPFFRAETLFFVVPARFQECSEPYHLLHPKGNRISRIILARRSVTTSSRLPDHSAVRGRFFRQMAVRLFSSAPVPSGIGPVTMRVGGRRAFSGTRRFASGADCCGLQAVSREQAATRKPLFGDTRGGVHWSIVLAAHRASLPASVTLPV